MESSRLESLWDKDKFEVTLRVGVMSLCGFALSIASIPQVLPPSQALMPGLLCSSLSQMLPTLMFSLLGVFPTILVLMVTICGWTTMLLTTGSVSEGLFLGIYSIYTLFMTTLFFGKFYSVTNGTANAFIAMGGLLASSYLPLVQKEGLGAVSDMWTEKGTENQLAVWRNFLIAVCWGLACVALGILLPPWQTSRRMITRGLFPSIFKQVNTVLSGDNYDVKALDKSKVALKDGNVVMTTLFEPRVFALGVDDLTPMKQVAVDTDEMVFRSLLVLHWKEGMTEPPNDVDTAVLNKTSTLLDMCGSALVTDDQVHFDSLRDFAGNQAYDIMAKVGSDENDDVEIENIEDSNASFIYKQALQVRASTLTYLQTFHGTTSVVSKQGFLHVVKEALVYIALPLLPTMRLAEASTLIFQPKKWKFESILWSLELSAGFVALMAMTVYWDSYSAFRIVPSDSYVGPVYSGWNLMGYAFAWRPTHEGTVKKGIQRILGTCLGGFAGWLGIIVCSWSFADDATINPYGLTAWLTVFTMLCAYFASLASGPVAHFGSDKDHGYVGMYFSMTEALIALEVFLGAGGKNGLTLNRIVATVTGVLMAVIISFLPPHVNGRDPKHTRDYVNSLRDAFMELLHVFADENESSKITSDNFKSTIMSPVKEKRDYAVFVLNDADMLQFLPFFKVNKELRPLIDSAAVEEATIRHLIDGFSEIITNEVNVNETRTAITMILDELDASGGKLLESQPDASVKSDVTVATIYGIVRQLNVLEKRIDKIAFE